jgi:3alpha(or 20beta)-hydroxysteroid dehydrogenase
LAGKIAIVTGGAQGIGGGIADVLAQHGAHVAIADVNTELAAEKAASLPGDAMMVPLDVRDQDAWRGAVEAVLERWGRIDILVNNAGTGAGGPIEETDLAVHRNLVELNLDGVWLGVRAVVPAMASGGGGSIVNISSIDGLIGVPHLSSYVATKFAVTGMTRSLAMELADRNIRVNSVHPGITATPLVNRGPEAVRERLNRAIQRQPIKRMGTPSDIGYAVLFFASDESSYCTGTQLVVDGGQLAGPYRDPH